MDKYTLKIDGEVYGEFESYSGAYDTIENLELDLKGHLELFYAMGTDQETVEDV